MLQETHFIQGPAGQLETVVNLPESVFSALAIICHPHPLFGGSMQNKVVHTLARTYRELGLAAVRFNFRGVGGSSGTFAHGIGETDDLLAVVSWAQQVWPGKSLYLAGFSFGTYVALRACATVACKHLILVAPPVHNFDFTALNEPHCPWLVVQGEEDEVVPAEQVFNWIGGLHHHPQVLRMPAATHFFHGHLIELREQLAKIIQPIIPR